MRHMHTYSLHSEPMLTFRVYHGVFDEARSALRGYMHQCSYSAVISCLVAYTFMTHRDPIEMMHTKYGLLLKPVLLLQTALYGVPSRFLKH